MTLVAGLVAIMVLPTALVLHGGTYYVSQSGNDSYAGTKTQPFATIKKGLGQMGTGDTLYLRAGTYVEDINSNTVTIPTGTSWANAPVISGYPNEVIVLKPSGASAVLNLPDPNLHYIIFKDMILDGTNLARSQYASVGIGLQQGTNHLRFQNIEIQNSPWSGILGGGSYHEFINLRVHDNGRWAQEIDYTSGCNGAYLTTEYSIIDGGEYYDNQCYGVRFFNSASTEYGNGNVIKNARLYENGNGIAFNGASVCNSGGGGIVLGDANNAAYNNLVYGNLWGAQTGSKPSNVFICNNTFYGNSYGIDIGSSSTAAKVRNNILYQNGSGISDAGSGTIFSTNLCSAAGIGCSLTGDPKFINVVSSDFHLQPGSPALDVGANLYSAGVITDFAGTVRPQGTAYDVGAFEYVSSSIVGRAPHLDHREPNTFTVRQTAVGEVSINWKEQSQAHVTVYSLPGKRIASIENIFNQSVIWNSGKLPLGVYLVKMISGKDARTVKICLGK